MRSLPAPTNDGAAPASPIPPRPADIDEVTLARAQRGDRAAFRVIVDRFEGPVCSVLGRMLAPSGRQALVEDLAQETFLRLHRALPRFGRDGRRDLGAFVLTIAARLAIDELRRLSPALAALDGDTAPAPAGADPVERRTLAEAIGRAVAGLGPEQRAVFLLREVHGLDYLEIAAAMGVDLGTVKSRLSRARAALRAALAEVHDE